MARNDVSKDDWGKLYRDVLRLRTEMNTLTASVINQSIIASSASFDYGLLANRDLPAVAGDKATYYATDSPNGGTMYYCDGNTWNQLSDSFKLIDTKGDLIVGTADNTAAKLVIGTAGQVLTVAGGTATWATPAPPLTWGTLAARPTLAASGAMYFATDTTESGKLFYYDAGWKTLATNFDVIDAAGDLIVGTGDNAVTRLPKGADGKVLGVTAGAVGWVTPAAGGGAYSGVGTLAARPTAAIAGAGGRYYSTDGNGQDWVSNGTIWIADNAFNVIDVPGDLLVGSADNAVARLAKGANGQVLRVSSTGNVIWDNASNVYGVPVGAAVYAQQTVLGQTPLSPGNAQYCPFAPAGWVGSVNPAGPNGISIGGSIPLNQTQFASNIGTDYLALHGYASAYLVGRYFVDANNFNNRTLVANTGCMLGYWPKGNSIIAQTEATGNGPGQGKNIGFLTTAGTVPYLTFTIGANTYYAKAASRPKTATEDLYVFGTSGPYIAIVKYTSPTAFTTIYAANFGGNWDYTDLQFSVSPSNSSCALVFKSTDAASTPTIYMFNMLTGTFTCSHSTPFKNGQTNGSFFAGCAWLDDNTLAAIMPINGPTGGGGIANSLYKFTTAGTITSISNIMPTSYTDDAANVWYLRDLFGPAFYWPTKNLLFFTVCALGPTLGGVPQRTYLLCQLQLTSPSTAFGVLSNPRLQRIYNSPTSPAVGPHGLSGYIDATGNCHLGLNYQQDVPAYSGDEFDKWVIAP